MNSFCFQCEQTFQGTGCTEMGMCGKDQESSVLQDLIVFACKGLAQYAHRARKLGVVDQQIDELARLLLQRGTVTRDQFHNLETTPTPVPRTRKTETRG